MRLSLVLRMTFASLLLALSACATNSPKIVAQPEAQDHQVVIEAKGAKGLTSIGDVTSVTASIAESTPVNEACLVVELGFTNLTDQTTEILPGSFVARNDKRQSYLILSGIEYEAVLNEKYTRKLQGSSGSQTNTGSFVDSSAYTGSTSISSSGDSSYARNTGRNQSLEARMKKYVEAYLSAVPLPAKESTEGRICIALPQDDKSLNGLLLTVPTGSDVHKFKFSLMKTTQ